MNFEEKFPSLKDKVKTESVPTFPDGSLVCDGVLYKDDVEKHCLDKKKVKEVIDFIFRDKYGIRMAEYDNAIQTLGLDK